MRFPSMKRAHVRIIYVAFAISIAGHFLIGPLVHFKFVDAAPEPKPGHIIIVRVIPPKPKPTKPPIQQRTTAQRPVARPAHPAAPRVANKDNKNVGTTEPRGPAGPGPIGPITDGPNPGPVVASAGPPPTPSPTPKPVCSAPYVEAATIEKYAPEMPEIAKEQGLSGSAQVEVNLSASGQVTAAKIYVSTGSTALDNAAIEAARRTTYTPKIVDCDRVPGSYLFRVDFQSN